MKLCWHRGHRLNENGSCPYHGLSPAACALAKKHGPLPVMEPRFGERSKVISEIGTMFMVETHRVKCHWTIWMQNTMDPHHLAEVHRGGFYQQFEDDACPYDIQVDPESWYSSHKLAVRREIVDAFRSMLGPEVIDYFFHMVTDENTSVTCFLGAFYSVERAYDRGSDECQVISSFYTTKHRKVPEALIQRARVANAKILSEDRAICESWHPTARVTGNWLPGEERIIAYINRLRKAGLYPEARHE